MLSLSNFQHLAAAHLRTASRCRAGTIGFKFAMILPVLLLMSGTAIDHGRFLAQRAVLQGAADAAALAAAAEMSLTDTMRESLSAVATQTVADRVDAQDSLLYDGKPVVTTTINGSPLEVDVSVVQRFKPAFGNMFGFTLTEVHARAVARVVGRPNICVLALEPSEPGAIWLVKSAKMTGNNCSVFSNSTASNGLAVREGAAMTAFNICSAGGVDNNGAMSPEPLIDCPQFDDPLASRPEPTIGTCDYTNTSIVNETRTLNPGVYCGGLNIRGTSNVTLNPGVYTIHNGMLTLSDGATLVGEEASFYLGPSSWLMFGPNTTVRLRATKSGPLAGLLFFGSRQQSKLLTHLITSKNAQELVGTIYLPRNSFVVDGDAAVGATSAYTAIVARRLVLLNGPHLVLNSNYEQTDVPVPDGIKGAGQPVALKK